MRVNFRGKHEFKPTPLFTVVVETLRRAFDVFRMLNSLPLGGIVILPFLLCDCQEKSATIALDDMPKRGNTGAIYPWGVLYYRGISL
jgi:hypothetical protein